MLATAVSTAALAAYSTSDLSDTNVWGKIAADVNAAGNGWTANASVAKQFPTLGHVKMLCGTFTKGHPQYKHIDMSDYDGSVSDLPTDFDPRTKWPKCTILGKVRNQAGCGSCWAFGSTESFEGRRCIATGNNIEYSASDTAFCSGAGFGCSGGQPTEALEWMESSGVVTGGEYGEDNGCVPYQCPPCKKGDEPDNGCPTNECGEPKCTRSCTNKDYNKTYSTDKTKCTGTHRASSVAKMQGSLMNAGPLSVAFTVYGDFPAYTSGVYSHTSGSALGGHAVTIYGWGEDAGKAYWLVKNSWTDKWGDKGWFKIARGNNECGIEEEAAGPTFK